MPFLNNEGLEVVKEIIESKYAGKNADGAVVSVGADYAEYGDWADGNPDGENRKGYFVTIAPNSNDIQIANSASAITGVTTDSAGFIGNYSKGAESDASKGLVGIVGQISVIDNGTCTVGARCMPTDDGTAVPSSNNCGYLVIDRIDSDHVRILVAPTIDMIQRIKTDVSELQDGAPYYTLGLGTEIPAGADLNDYVEPGIYYGVYGSYLNAPSPDVYGKSAFVLEVRNGTAQNEFLQIFKDAGNGVTWTRAYFSGAWQVWHCTGGVDSIVAEGITSGWNWIKYANGTAEAHVRIYTTAPKIAFRANSYYQYGISNFPFEFKDVPFVYVTASSAGYADLSSCVNKATTKDVDWNIATPSGVTDGRNVYVNIYVRGDWK